MLDESRYISDRLKPQSDEWKNGPKISLEDCKNGTGFIQKISGEELRKNRPAAAADDTMSFGKYRGEKVKDVARKNPQYLQWAAETIPGFAAKVKKAGVKL